MVVAVVLKFVVLSAIGKALLEGIAEEEASAIISDTSLFTIYYISRTDLLYRH
jgi:hypothetical protein